MKRIASAVLIGGMLGAVLLAGCGGGGGGGDNGGGGGGGGTTTIVISGTVVSSANLSQGVAGVSVSLGSLGSGFEQTAITGANGAFSITVPVGLTSVLQMYPSFPYNFRVSTANAGPAYPTSLPVSFNGTSYDPISGVASIPVPAAVLTATASTSLGTIVVTYYDPNNPPPPPF